MLWSTPASQFYTLPLHRIPSNTPCTIDRLSPPMTHGISTLMEGLRGLRRPPFSLQTLSSCIWSTMYEGILTLIAVTPDAPSVIIQLMLGISATGIVNIGISLSYSPSLSVCCLIGVLYDLDSDSRSSNSQSRAAVHRGIGVKLLSLPARTSARTV